MARDYSKCAAAYYYPDRPTEYIVVFYGRKPSPFAMTDCWMRVKRDTDLQLVLDNFGFRLVPDFVFDGLE